MAKEYDLVILGGGTGGYVAAIRAAQLGLKAAIVEKDKLGGTCLHKGCIPSKALLKSAEVYRTAKEADQFGIMTEHPTINFSKVIERKNQIVSKLYTGVQYLIKKGKIDVYSGTGRILGPSIFSPLPGAISVEYEDSPENDILQPKNVIIATGSRPKHLPGLPNDKEIMTSDEALALDKLPQSIVIVGGGVIGIEWASMFIDFGVDVTVLETADQIVPNMDKEIALELRKSLENKGMKIDTNTTVLTDTYVNDGKTVRISAESGDQQTEYSAEAILISVGREGNIDNIGLQNTGITTKNQLIEVNSYYQTNDKHIYAIGDCIGGLQLAHVAAMEGIRAVEHIAGEKLEEFDLRSIPSCIYSHPECASIGMTEKQALNENYQIKIGKFPFQANGKALIQGNADGFVKIIADKHTDDILGVHIIGENATELISEASLATLLDATPWEISTAIHPHPSLSETIGEAALAVDGNALHI